MPTAIAEKYIGPVFDNRADLLDADTPLARSLRQMILQQSIRVEGVHADLRMQLRAMTRDADNAVAAFERGSIPDPDTSAVKVTEQAARLREASEALHAMVATAHRILTDTASAQEAATC